MDLEDKLNKQSCRVEMLESEKASYEKRLSEALKELDAVKLDSERWRASTKQVAVNQ